jgi:hypothetical protein
MQLVETQSEGAEEGAVDRVDIDTEGAALIYWTSSEETLGLLARVPQQPQNKSVGPRIPAQLVQYILIQVNTRNQLYFCIYTHLCASIKNL